MARPSRNELTSACRALAALVYTEYPKRSLDALAEAYLWDVRPTPDQLAALAKVDAWLSLAEVQEGRHHDAL